MRGMKRKGHSWFVVVVPLNDCFSVLSIEREKRRVWPLGPEGPVCKGVELVNDIVFYCCYLVLIIE